MKFLKTLMLLTVPFHLIGSTDSDDPCCSAKSIFVPRSITQDSTYEYASTLYNLYYPERGYRLFQSLNAFYQQSRSKDDLTKYFLPDCKCSIDVKEDGTGDVDPLWFDVIARPLTSPPSTYYSSTFSLDPSRSVFGITAYWQLYLIHRLWLGINTALVHAMHKLNPHECHRENPGAIDGFATFIDGINNPDWSYGKIFCGKKSKTGIDDIQLKLGFDFIATDYAHLSLYARTTIPTGRKITAEYLFEPRVGTHNASLGGGINGSYVFHNGEQNKLVGLVDLKAYYTFSATERRSFDLTNNGDWSRYLLVIARNAGRVVDPGINLMTQDATVTPRSTIELFAALHYEHKKWNLELGYNLWRRAGEKVCLDTSCFAQNYGIFNLGCLCEGTVSTSSTAKISQGLVGSNIVEKDDTFTTITLDDFNLCSATHDHTLTHKIFGIISYKDLNSKHIITPGLGGSYEFSSNANALDQWAIWFNLGLIF